MNHINHIYTTVSNGQVHIAADTKYIGSVNSYNNYFTQFFAWLSGRSMKVNFDDKIRSVNKKSYSDLIRSLTQTDKINDIRQRNMFKPIAEATTLPQNNLKMRDVISSEVRQELFENLAYAISLGYTEKALKMIGKGAELDRDYYDRGKYSPSFSKDTSDLDSDSRYTFTVFKAAPLLQAARKGHTAICQFLKEAGADTSIEGKQYTFKRDIINIEKHLELIEEPVLVAHYNHTRGPYGVYRGTVDYSTEYRPQLQEYTTITTQDSRQDAKTYQLDKDSFNLIEVCT